MPAHLSGARPASFLQLNTNEVSLTLSLPASPQGKLRFVVSHLHQEGGPLKKLRGSGALGVGAAALIILCASRVSRHGCPPCPV